MNRPTSFAVGVIVAAVGFFCLNFTNGFGIEHHTEWAKAHGMPPPSPTIFFAGVALLTLGSAIFGFSIGRKRG